MAKESGLGMTLGVDDSGGTLRQIENDVTNVQFAMPSNVQDVTGLDKSGMERLLLLADFSITITSIFNDAANRAFAVFKNYRTIFAGQVGRTTTIVHSGQTLTNEVLYSDYANARGQDVSLVGSSPGSLADGTVPSWA